MSAHTDTIATRRARVRRHCSTLCIAVVVARFMPAIALVEPEPRIAVLASPAMEAAATFFLSAHFCPARGVCGSATATISVESREAPSGGEQ